MSDLPDRVTPSEPCEHCGKGDHRCSRFKDGIVSICYRVGGPGAVEKLDAGGSTYFVYGLQDKGDQVDASAEAGEARQSRASDDELHAVYSAMLGILKLSKAHERDMLGRGFREGEAFRIGYRTLPDRGRNEILSSLDRKFGVRTLLSVPGFFVNDREKLGLSALPGLLIPARDERGRILALTVRPDQKLDTANKYLWISSARKNGPGPGAPVHVPMGLAAPADGLVVVTEGLIKSDLTHALWGIPTIGNPGVGNWRGSLPILKRLGARTVRVAYDRDWRDKADVARNLVNFAKALREVGFEVEVVTWEGEHKGIDDLLAGGGCPRVHVGQEAEAVILAAARVTGNASDEAPTPGLPIRLRAKIEADGLAGLLRDKGLLAELARLEVDDPGEFGAIVVELRSIKDFPLREFRAAVRGARPADRHGLLDHSYREKAGCLFVGDEKLSNFIARITEEVIRDDGSEESRIDFRIEARGSHGREMAAEIKAEEFEAMKWVVTKLGGMAILEAGRGFKDHIRAAIQHLSGEIPRRTIFTHTGWRKIGGEWKYLHVGGAIGADGLDPTVSVEMKGSLSSFKLPPPPSGVERARAIRASLGILRFGSPLRPSSRALAGAMISATYRAAICKTGTSLAFTGDSDAFKSSAAALAQQHFGPEMDNKHLPFNWSSTANYLEMDLYFAKDTLAVVDEFTLTGDSSDMAKRQAKADRLIRAGADGHARGRLDKDGNPLAPKPPRALMLSTGEDGFDRLSANARTIPIQFSRNRGAQLGTVDQEILTECQDDAKQGQYAASMAAFLQWLAPRYEEVLKELQAKAEEYRAMAHRPGDHGRSPEAVADLFAGFEIFLDFAIEAGAINEEDASRDRQLVWDGLMDASAEVRADITDEGSPTERFLGLLASAMASNHAHLVDHGSGEEPAGREAACGWSRKLMYQGNSPQDGRVQDYEWQPSNNKIGWIDSEHIYLIRDAAYRVAVKEIGTGDGSPLPSSKQLSKQLHSDGKLARTDSRNKTEKKSRYTSRETIQGSEHSVLVIRIKDILGGANVSASQDDPVQEVKIGESA